MKLHSIVTILMTLFQETMDSLQTAPAQVRRVSPRLKKQTQFYQSEWPSRTGKSAPKRISVKKEAQSPVRRSLSLAAPATAATAAPEAEQATAAPATPAPQVEDYEEFDGMANIVVSPVFI
jgi:hypothetical protein